MARRPKTATTAGGIGARGQGVKKPIKASDQKGGKGQGEKRTVKPTLPGEPGAKAANKNKPVDRAADLRRRVAEARAKAPTMVSATNTKALGPSGPTKVSQATIDSMKTMGMTAAIKKAAAGGASAEFKEGARRMYGQKRIDAARPKAELGPAQTITKPSPALKANLKATREAAKKPRRRDPGGTRMA